MIKNISKGLVGTIIAVIAQLISGFFSTHLITKHLTPIYSSSWFLFYSILQLVYVLDFGISPTFSRKIAFCHQKAGIDKLQLKLVIENVLSINLIVAPLVILAISGIGCVYIYYTFAKIQHLTIILSFLYFLIGVFFLYLNIPYLALNYGFGNVFTERFLRALVLMITPVSLFVLFMYTNNFEIICLIWSMINLLLHFIIRAYCCVKYKISFFTFHLDKETSKSVLVDSSRQGFGGLAPWFVFQAGYFIVGHQLGIKYVTQYAPLMQLAMGIFSLAMLIQYVCSPFISRLYIQGELNKVINITLKFNQLMMLVICTAAVFLYVNAPLILRLWLGPQFNYVPTVFAFLLATIVLEVNHFSFVTNAAACGYLKFVRIAWLGAIFCILFMTLFSKWFGFIGISLGLFIGQLTTNNWGALYLSLKFFKIPFKTYFLNVKNFLLYFLILSASMYLITFIFKKLFIVLILTALMCTVFFLASIFLLEKKFICSLLRKIL
jgi:O-antigen/teichoic acid export membrane protein